VKFRSAARRLRPFLVAGAIALGTTLSAQLGAAADTSLDIPTMGQQDPAWGAAPLGTSPTDTIASSGCAITALAMMLGYYGNSTDPGALNSWLTANGGYAFDDAVIWDAVNRFSGGQVVFSNWTGPDLDLIRAELDAGRPVVAEVRLDGNQHFVLITGDRADGGFQINDPWFADSVNFSDRYGDPASGIVSIRTFMTVAPPAPPPGTSWPSWIASTRSASHLAQ